jgi:hypothetical protein
VFLNLLGAADGALIRAAASTQPLSRLLMNAQKYSIWIEAEEWAAGERRTPLDWNAPLNLGWNGIGKLWLVR